MNDSKFFPRTIKTIERLISRDDTEIFEQRKQNKKNKSRQLTSRFNQNNKTHRQARAKPKKNSNQNFNQTGQRRGQNSRQDVRRLRQQGYRPGNSVVLRERPFRDTRSIPQWSRKTISSSSGRSGSVRQDEFIRRGGVNPKLLPVERSFSRDGTVVRMSGGELFYNVRAFTTLSTTPAPTASGDVVICIPLNPCFIVGTQLWQEAKNWTKWRIRGLKARYVPNSGGLQTGSWIMCFDHNPSDPNTISTSGIVRERRYTGMEDSCMFSVSDIGECTFRSDFTTPLWFPVNPGTGDDDLTVEALFLMVAGSSFTPIGTETFFDTGMLVFDYDVEFTERTNNTLSPALPNDVYFNSNGTNTLTFGAPSLTSPVSILQSQLVALGITLTQLFQLCIVTITKTLSSGGNPIPVNDYHQTAMNLFTQGTVYYLRLQDAGGPAFVYLSLSDAINIGQNTTLEFQNTILGATVTTFSGYANTIDLRL